MLLPMLVLGVSSTCCAAGTSPPPPPLKALLITGGVCHDFAALVPELKRALESTAGLVMDVREGLSVLDDARFADPYDVVIHDFCFDEAKDDAIEHALEAVRSGKPAVMIHCAVHSFRNSSRVRLWEECCGMRSKVHDPYQAFTTEKRDPKHPILDGWPDAWRTEGDELYQTIELLPAAHALLAAKSPKDGREHVVSWTSTFGKGRVFATTLGHDLKTAGGREYQRLLANGVLWACGRLPQAPGADPIRPAEKSGSR